MARKNTYIGSENNVYVAPTGINFVLGTDSDLTLPFNNTGAASGVTLTAIYPRGAGWTAEYTLSSVAITHTDATTSGSSGSVKLGEIDDTLFDSYIAEGGSILLDTVTDATNTSMVIHWGVGTVAADAGDGALTTTEDNLIQSSAAAALSSGAGSNVAVVSSTAGNVDTATANDIYLNESGTAATSGADSTVTVSGKVYIHLMPGLTND